MTKSFKIARKPGQTRPETRSDTELSSETAVQAPRRRKGNGTVAVASPASSGITTRKTIEVPEDYFYQVKMRALQRRLREKDLWAEILEEYFKNHPTL